MRHQLQAITLASTAQLAFGFPHMAMQGLDSLKLAGRADAPASGVPVPDPAQVAGIFDPTLQYVSNTGEL
jgi:hypothetical protein